MEIQVQTDADLVRAVLEGQKQAFAALVKRYERSVRAIAMNVLNDHESVQDIAQEAFLKAYENLSGLRRPRAFGPWLMKIARRCALNVASQRPTETALDPTDASSVQGTDGQLDEEKQRLVTSPAKV
jgi:RNA polymerase sigma-70 factor (ECF subfamily)